MESEKIRWALHEFPIKDLKDHPKNPRQIGKDQLTRLGNLIDKFGEFLHGPIETKAQDFPNCYL